MTRFLWVLALPYVVVKSTMTEPYTFFDVDLYQLKNAKGVVRADSVDREYMEDMAYTLNEAHERRTKTIPAEPVPCGADGTGPKNCAPDLWPSKPCMPGAVANCGEAP